MGNIIAISGTQGTGKTTTVYSKANELKMNNTNKDVGMILEVARRCPFKINEKAFKEAQLWIFSEQITTELLISSAYDIVVCDGSIIDIIAYTMALGYKNLGDAMLGIAENHIHIYKEIHFKSIEKNNDLKDAGSVDMNFRIQVERGILFLYRYFSDNFEGKIYFDS